MRMLTNLFLGVFLILFWGSSISQEVGKPKYEKGDWCEYESNSRLAGVVRQEIVEVSPDGGFQLLVKDGRGSSTRFFDRDHQLLKRDNIEYSPAWVMPKHPYKVGMTGGGKFNYPHPRMQGKVEAESSVTGVTFEKNVKVPAGTFDTMKIEVTTAYQAPNGYSNSMIQTAWFSTDTKIKRYVMMKFVDRGGGPEEIQRLIACGDGGGSK